MCLLGLQSEEPTHCGKVGALSWERGHHTTWLVTWVLGIELCPPARVVSTLPSHSSQPQNLYLLFCVVVNIQLITKIIYF